MRAPDPPDEVRLEDLALFVVLCEERSFTRAALRLGVNKSTVSRRLELLERLLDTRLVERSSRHLQVTEAGQPFLRRASRIVDEARSLTRSLRDASDAPRGLLRVTTTDLLAQALVVPVAAEYLRRYPGTRVEVLATQERLDILADGVDLALRVGPLEDSSHVARSFGVIATGLYASPSYLDGRGVPRTPEDLARHDFVLTLEGGRPRPIRLIRGGRSIEVPVQGPLVVNSILLGRDAALAGAGIARLPRFLVAEALRSGALRRVLPGWHPGSRAFHALYSRAERLPPKVRTFLDLLLARAAASPRWS